MGGETRTIRARCLCGVSNHKITLPDSAFPLKAPLCHCHSCRHTTGGLCLHMVADLPPPYEPSQELLDKLEAFEFSKRLTYFHCRMCGTHMLLRCWRDADDHAKGATWDAGCGTLEKADGVFELTSHEHIIDTLDGGISDMLPQVDGEVLPRWPHGRFKPEKGGQPPTELQAFWRHHDLSIEKPQPSDKLHCHCKCSGVEFWISRPSEKSKRALAHSAGQLRENDSKYLAVLCACDSCRLASGREWMEWAFIPTIDIALDADGQRPFKFDIGTLRKYRSSEATNRYFCATCGATVFYARAEWKSMVNVAVGLFDAPEGARAESWLALDTRRLCHRGDSIYRAESVTLAVEAGLKNLNQRRS